MSQWQLAGPAEGGLAHQGVEDEVWDLHGCYAKSGGGLNLWRIWIKGGTKRTGDGGVRPALMPT
jgi:hypothetical protein